MLKSHTAGTAEIHACGVHPDAEARKSGNRPSPFEEHGKLSPVGDSRAFFFQERLFTRVDI